MYLNKWYKRELRKLVIFYIRNIFFINKAIAKWICLLTRKFDPPTSFAFLCTILCRLLILTMSFPYIYGVFIFQFFTDIIQFHRNCRIRYHFTNLTSRSRSIDFCIGGIWIFRFFLFRCLCDRYLFIIVKSEIGWKLVVIDAMLLSFFCSPKLKYK